MPTAFDDISSLLSRETLQDAVEHLCHIVKYKCAYSIHSMIENMRITMKEAIEVGLIGEFSDLLGYIRDHDFTEVCAESVELRPCI